MLRNLQLDIKIVNAFKSLMIHGARCAIWFTDSLGLIPRINRFELSWNLGGYKVALNHTQDYLWGVLELWGICL